MNIYRNISELMLYHFDKLINSEDLYWLIEGYDGYNKPEKTEDLNAIWIDILQQYEEFSGDGTGLSIARKQTEIASLLSRHERALIGIEMYFTTEISKENKAKLKELLGKDNFIIDHKKNDQENSERLFRQCTALYTKIKLKVLELDAMMPNKGKEVRKMDLEESLFILENVVDVKYQLSTRHVSVKRYLMLIKEAERRNQSNGKR